MNPVLSLLVKTCLDFLFRVESHVHQTLIKRNIIVAACRFCPRGINVQRVRSTLEKFLLKRPNLDTSRRYKSFLLFPDSILDAGRLSQTTWKHI